MNIRSIKTIYFLFASFVLAIASVLINHTGLGVIFGLFSAVLCLAFIGKFCDGAE
jgi:hypothetical protein